MTNTQILFLRPLQIATISNMLVFCGALSAMESPAIESGKELVSAATRDDWKRVETLIADGADVNQTDESGFTVLMVAAVKNKIEIAQMLINRHADLNLKSEDGFTALMWAVFNGHLEFTQMLIKAGADVNQQDQDGKTALMIALDEDNEIAKIIIDAQADLYQKDALGRTALMTASLHRYTDIAQKIIDVMLANPIDPSKAPKKLTDEQKEAIYTLALSLKKGDVAKFVSKDTVQLILKNLATVFRQQNFVREQINEIRQDDMKTKLIAYFESKIRDETEKK